MTPRRSTTSLVDAAKRGDRRSRELLVAEYLPAVRAIAYRYRGFGLPIEDLIQEGSLGMLDAIEHYEPERSDDFESYARFRIRRSIRTALTEQSRMIRLPKQIVEHRRAIERAESAFKSATGHAPTPAELGDVTGLSAAAVAAIRDVGTAPLSLDQPVFEDGSTLEALVVDSSAPDPEAETVERAQAREVGRALAALPARQREIVSRHFGLGRDAEQIAEVAAALHVSEQRARAIERDALYALRDRLEPAFIPRRAR